ncbi:MAG: hypothetical protein ICV73_29530 [Acetobacteraceae bacterium]|nr:hypothetical protein [Acetobacteraceae bacterium]
MLRPAMVCRPAAAAVLAVAALFAFPAAAGAQTRTLVVPGDAAVVVPPRGSALPRPALKPIAAHRPRLPPMAPAAREDGGTGLGGVGTVAGVVLPAIAAAAVAVALSNGNGAAGGQATSGPVRTR